MSTITIDASEVYAFGARMRGGEAVVRSEVGRSMDRLVIQGEGFAKQNAPVRTGHLRRSIAYEATSWAGATARAAWGTATPYAEWVENGRGPVVARGRALRFEIAGRVIYRKRVGPAKGSRFMARSAERVRPLVGKEMDAAGNRIVLRLVGG